MEALQKRMTWIDGLVALAVICGFVYIIIAKMKEKNRGRAVLGWTSQFSMKNLVKKPVEVVKETSEQRWIEKRNVV